MNPGGTNTPHKIDLWVERLNKKIARLLGKKNRQPKRPTEKTSNMAFCLIILSFTLMLWLVTGFYYLSESQSGLILYNGKVTKVVKGIKVGFTAPYPFGGIEIIDSGVSDLIDVGKMSLTATTFTVSSQDIEPILVDAKFMYQIIDPQLAFQTVLQQQDNLDMFVAWQVQLKLHDYFLHQKTDEVLKANLTIVDNEVKDELNARLAKIGIKVSKLNVYSLQTPLMLVAKAESTSAVAENVAQPPVVATELLQQAMAYKQDLLIDTKVNINQFNQLLPQYRMNHNAIVTQMYYDTLSVIPLTKADNYPLLSIPLSQLLLETESKPVPPDHEEGSVAVRERHFGREVNRMRGGDGSENE